MTNIPQELKDRFDIHETLVTGSTGTLYRATDTTAAGSGPTTLKVIDPGVYGSNSDRQRIKRELVKQTTLSHPNLMLPHVTGEAGKTLWLARNWVPGRTLAERLTDGALAGSEVLAVAAQVAGALDELHRAGLLFRDLKPSHIVVQEDLTVVCIDAGLAAPIQAEDVFDLYGTPTYVSPEQAKGKLVSFRSDLYSLGCVLFEAATGDPPFQGDTAELLRSHAEVDAPEVPSGLPDELAKLIAQLLSKDPRERPFSAQQVRRTLNPLLPDELRALEGDSPSKRPSSTLVGMPAMGGPPSPPSMRPSAPPRPPSMSKPPSPPSMSKPPEAPEAAASEAPEPVRKPGTTPKGNPDATQQVALEDIVDQKPLRVSAPPPTPPSMRPSGTPSVPPPPPGSTPPTAKPPVDRTQQLAAQDIEEVEEEFESLSEPPPAGVDEPDAFPDAALAVGAVGAMAAGAVAADAAAAPVGAADAAAPVGAAPVGAAPVGAAPEMDDLDYDDLAETIAREAPSEVAAAPAADPQPQPEQAAPAAAVGAHAASAAVSEPPPPRADESTAREAIAQPQPESRNGVYFLAGGALVFLAACLFVGYQVIKDSDEPEAIAAVPTPNTASAPTTNLEAQLQAQLEAARAQAAAAAAAQAAAAQAAAAEAAASNADAEAAEAEAEAQLIAEAEAEEAVEVAEERIEEAHSMDTAMSGRTGRSMRTSMASSMGASRFDQAREAAREHFQARRFPQAEQAYLAATASNPRHAGSWAGLGAARMQMRNFNGAVQAYQRAVQLSPRHGGFFTALGHALRMSGNRNGARQAYQRALAIDPNNRSAQQAIAQL